MNDFLLLKNLDILSKNPILLSLVIDNFYKFSIRKEKNILLVYLIIPLVLSENTRLSLCNSKATSSLFTFCGNNNNISMLQNKILNQKNLSIKSLYVSLSSKRLKLNDDLSIDFIKENEQINNIYLEEKKAAKKLAFLLNSFDVNTIYRIFGVKFI
ncbi:three component ABC system middle component [Fluviispira vulneris]|uniref:three component ABC system middle component n=1 Tax=Fluviispira vulneris TaxID=2763012 RepID=UPI001644807A|nr:three component ABC system middle component [Fluviispira vulneris]